MERWLVPAVVVLSLITLMVIVLASVHVSFGGALSGVFALGIAVPLAFVFAHSEKGHHRR